jgi:hypothetical protein
MDFLEMWLGWGVIAGILLGFAITTSALVYMLSELLQNDKMKGWAKIELTEVFYSALILMMVVPGLTVVDQVVQGGLLGDGGSDAITTYWIPMSDAGTFGSAQRYYSYNICGPEIAAPEKSVYHGVQSCHIRLGIWYMRSIFDEAKTFAFDIYLSYIGSSMLEQFTINIEFLFEKAGFMTFTPWRGFFTMGNKAKELIFDWAIKLMMVTKFQEVLLYFISTALFPPLFTVGTVLRTFAFTRKLGGLLMAMAIALYFVFPAFYSFGALVMLDIKKDITIRDAWMADINANPSGSPDPPIANSMYINGEIPMPGGNKAGFSTAEAQQKLRDYEGMDSDTYFKYMEEGKDGAGASVLPMYDAGNDKMLDMTSTARAGAPDADKEAALANSKKQVDVWFGNTSKYGKLDKFVGRVWVPNGPLDTLGRLTFWSMFFSLFGIISTIAAIRSLSITFGGDIEIAGLTRLI